MANTYTQIYVQIVFVVQGRLNLIKNEHKDELHKYTTGIINKKNQKLISINCMPDHVHIFIGIKPNIAISDLARDIKNNSSKFINTQKWIVCKFNWQRGFGAFSSGHSQIDTVVKYIKNQERHHTHKSFREEYLEFLERFSVEYNEKYIFDWVKEVD
ncbi:MAG: IS200/IS605 family transposase [Calditrichota bacterium]|jgi:putative transposase